MLYNEFSNREIKYFVCWISRQKDPDDHTVQWVKSKEGSMANRALCQTPSKALEISKATTKCSGGKRRMCN